VSALELVGKPVVMRGLRADDRFPGTAVGPKIGLVIRAIHPGLLFVKLRMGARKRWAPKGRRVVLACVVREATAREVAVNMVLAPLPAVAS